MRRGGRQGKGKEVVAHSSFVPPTTYESFEHDSVAPTGSGVPSPTSQLPPSRASGSQSQVPDTAGSLGSEVPKLIIRPRTHNKFNHQLLCNQKIGDLIEMRFEGAWKSWKKFPKANRDLIFSEFAKYFEWDLNETSEIRRIFDICAANSIKNRMYTIRLTGKKPGWLGQAIYEELLRIFAADAFRKESEINKQNRQSDCAGQGFPQHVGGCVSHSEHIDRMTAKQGRAPTIAEAFMHLRSKVDSEGNVKWVNDRAKKTHDEFTTKLSQASSQSSNGDDIISKEQQMEIFADVVGGAKKGVIYGLAGQDYRVTLGSSSSSHGRMTSAWQNERTQMQEQLNALKSSIDDMQTSFNSRVASEVQHRVAEERQRLDAEMNDIIEAERQRLDAEMDERIEAKILARFASFNPRIPRSPPSNDQ